MLQQNKENMHKVLDVENLSVYFYTENGHYAAVNDISFSVASGEIFCLVGESGCGKSLTAKALLRLTPENTKISGKAFLNGVDMLNLNQKEIRAFRGQKVGMIFQEPMTALNPVLRIGHQCTEHMQLHLGFSFAQAKERCLELFKQVGISAGESRFNDYPHQLSGGMRQRVVIAMALACNPTLLLADEPTTALDVTIQWQILQLIQTLAEQGNRGVLLITHDLGVVAQMAHKVGIMYAGHMVEYGSVYDVLKNPLHPYTQGLLHSSPGRHSMDQARLPTIEGTVPPPYDLPSGCYFYPRCSKVSEKCMHEKPLFKEVNNHKVRCWLFD